MSAGLLRFGPEGLSLEVLGQADRLSPSLATGAILLRMVIQLDKGGMESDIALHKLGWKAFQDLCVALVEERLGRPVQTFLPTRDAGRDGAFLGRWDEPGGESTIQCKFSSKPDSNLTLSDLRDELPKAMVLAGRGMADDYLILTNHGVTGASELKIREAFEGIGVRRCRVFHRDWIVDRVRTSPKLRMMVPRLYGFADLGAILDERAYGQAQLILSEMGESLQRLVVTEAHRRSVRAISEHRLALLLGAPAAGKSTIGASLALGALDTWKTLTIKSTSPEHLMAHLDPAGGQFFWIDDAWGSTQYQRERTEAWNQAFPLIQGAMRKGSRFLITSRDYIWNRAKAELKMHALPVLGASQVVIDVQSLTIEEKARILYNHIKFGDQPESFRVAVQDLLPAIARRDDFLPESARRLGTSLFTGALQISPATLADFFGKPMEFLRQTIENLAEDARAAVALVFLNGGKVESPVPLDGVMRAASAYGIDPALVRSQLTALDGSLLKLVRDDVGQHWTYSHPTVGDAFAAYLAANPEMIETYLRGAKPDTIVREVVCAGVELRNAQVVVPNSLHDLLLERIVGLPRYSLVTFMSYRANSVLNRRLLDVRSDVWDDTLHLFRPIVGDTGTNLVIALHQQGLLPDDRREAFVRKVRAAVVEEADPSPVRDGRVRALFTKREYNRMLGEVRRRVFGRLDEHVERLRSEWDSDYDPTNHFSELQSSLDTLAQAAYGPIAGTIMQNSAQAIAVAVTALEARYEPPETDAAPTQQSASKTDSLSELFRDIAE